LAVSFIATALFMRAVYFSGPRFDRPLTLPKLYLKIVERRSRVSWISATVNVRC
jgi:hypothetical protein